MTESESPVGFHCVTPPLRHLSLVTFLGWTRRMSRAIFTAVSTPR
jgi:hypothetical protein